MPTNLPQPTDCCGSCDDETSTPIPGVKGDTGPAGADGSAGVSAYTITTASFTMPAVSANVTVDVANSSWMVVGEVLFVQSAGYFQVVSKPDTQSVVLTNLGYTGNAAPAVIIAALQQVGPSGLKGVDGSAAGITLNSLSPTNQKGDLLVDNGANNPNASLIRLGAPTNTYVWTADSTQASGWLAKNPKLTATTSLNFAAFAGLDTQDLTIALVGAVVGDPVELGCPAAIPAGLIPFAFVSAADVVTVRMQALIAVADPAAMNYTVRINKL